MPVGGVHARIAARGEVVNTSRVDASERQLWMQAGRKVALLVLPAGLVWLLSAVFLDEPLYRVAALILLAGGLHLGLMDRSPLPTRRPAWLRSGLAGVLVCLAVWLWLPPRPEAEMTWEPYSVAALERAAAEGRPVIIDFFADWCGPCHELDRRVFGNAEVVAATERFVRLRADLTDQNSSVSVEIAGRHAVLGLPTVILIGRNGQELRSLRLRGPEPASRFLARLRAVP